MTDEEVVFMRQVLEESKTTLSTVGLQLESLNRFMKAVGYQPVGQGQNFVLEDKTKPYPLQMNWSDAVKLHNYGFFILGYPKYSVPTAYRAYSVNSAHMLDAEWETKVVARVYLVWSKKRKEWFVQENRVNFC